MSMAPNMSIRTYLEQQRCKRQASPLAPANTEPGGPVARSSYDTSERRELVASYDEIDQIYDYIRGLAPLPHSLRSIKSIDFEQLEARERARRAQPHQPEARQRPPAAQRLQLAGVPAGRKQAKLRQRDRSGEPAVASPTPPPPQQQQQHPQPLATPIRVTTSAYESRRPTIKRVESLDVGRAAQHAAASPSYLLAGSPRNQPFRLPRAQSTSNLSRRAGEAAGSAALVPSDLVESFVDEDAEEEEAGADERESGTSSARKEPTANASSADTSTSYKSMSMDENSSTSSASAPASATSASTTPDTSASSSSSSARGSGRPSATSAPRAATREEHIYEQIPAHQDAHHVIARQAVERAPQPTPARPRLAPQPELERKSARLLNYPVAYSANVAANARHQQQLAALFALQRHQNARLGRPAPATSQFEARHPAPRPLSHMSHHQRLSMGNLQVALGSPMAGVFRLHSRRAQLAAGSDKAHGRAPRLSPGELIARIQMPRAVSKRQVAPAPAPTDSQQTTARRTISSGQVWQQAAAGARPAPGNKRASARRLTAIGIERALEPAHFQLVSAHDEGQRAKSSSRLAASGGSQSSGQSDGVRKNHQVAASSLQAAAGIKPRCLDSVSDVNSFSSWSQAIGSSSSSSSGDSERSSPQSHRLEPPATGRSGGETNSFSSFVMCAQQQRHKLADSDGRKAASRRLGSKLFGNGERLLSLIGLDTIGASSRGELDKCRPKEVASGKRELQAGAARRTSAPPTPLAGAATDQPQQQSALSAGRRFSNSGVNSGGKRGGKNRPPLATEPRPGVCHFEHPIVEIAKVPSEQQSKEARPQPSTQTQTQHRRSKAKNGDGADAGSSATTNSTSSYEAAIKNSSEQRAAARAKRVPSVSSTLATSSQLLQQQSALVGVPKLSKQSHLLNRPLPRLPGLRGWQGAATPPAGAHGPASSQTLAARHSLSLRSQPALTCTQTLDQRSQPRNSAAGANFSTLQGRSSERHGAGRSEPAASAQSRAAQLYLASQHDLRKQARPLEPASSSSRVALGVAKQTGQRLVSTNLDTRHVTKPHPRSPEPKGRQATGLKSPSSASQNQLSSLGTTHASPTVTTYTSSGISSTHLATNVSSSSSSQRSKASSKSRGQAGSQSAGALSGARSRTNSVSSNTLASRSSAGWQRAAKSDDERDEDERDLDDEDIDMIDGQHDNSISPDIIQCGASGVHRSQLKSFDERFSTKYVDQQLASSDDSLLESIELFDARRKRTSAKSPGGRR